MHSCSSSTRLLVVAVITTALITSQGAHAAPPATTPVAHHLTSIGFLVGKVSIRSSDGKYHGFALITLQQSGVVIGTTGPNAGVWYQVEVTTSLLPDRHEVVEGTANSSDVDLSTTSQGRFIVPIGNLGLVTFTTSPITHPVDTTSLHTYDDHYSSLGGASADFFEAALLQSWANVAVSGRAGDLTFTNTLAADVAIADHATAFTLSS